MSGSLHLLPVGLGAAEASITHPPHTLQIIESLEYFIVEKAKTTRAELKRLGYKRPVSSARIEELPERLDSTSINRLLAPITAGADGGLMSEAGCPAIADPGALLVRRAHQLDVRVVPHVGPSALLLALMASGLNGQSFAFHGYLPIKEQERTKSIRDLEQESRRLGRTQICIETPYRNAALLASLITECAPSTLLSVARSLTTPEEWICTDTVRGWRERTCPELNRQPTVFLLLAEPDPKARR